MQLTSLISTSSNGTCCFAKGAVKQGGGRNPIPQKQEEWEFLKSLAPPLMMLKKELHYFEKLALDAMLQVVTQYNQAQTLFTKDLQRNAIGKGRVPGFGEKCAPRGQCTFGARLQDEEIKILAEFVK